MKSAHKALFVSAALGLALSQSAHAQSVLVAGWDFNALPAAPGLNAVVSNYSDNYGTFTAADGSAASSRGTFLTNGTGGSENLPNSSAGIQIVVGTNVMPTDVFINTRGSLPGAVQNLGYVAGAENAVSIGGAAANPQSFAFQVDTTGVRLTEISTYLARSSASLTSTVAWSYKIGEAAPIAFGANSVVNQTVNAYGNFALDLSPLSLENVGLVSLIGTASYTGALALRIENTAIYGELAAIPEPSTYAAILGALSLVVAARRRFVRQQQLV